MANRKLSKKHLIFCREYIVDLNATQAYIRAGYKPKAAGQAADRLLKNVKILAEILALYKERADRVGVSADYVLNGLLRVAERCMADETFDAAGACKALELIGKHLGLFEKDNSQKGGTTVLVVDAITKPANAGERVIKKGD